MGFILFIVSIWALAMGTWLVVSKYAKSSDLDKIKVRLSGITKAKAASDKKKENDSSPTVVIQEGAVKNRFAQSIVDKYGLGPKIASMLEQAGLSWQPARFVHLTLVAFAAGFAAGWIFLGPFGKWVAAFTGLAAASLPYVYISFKRKNRLRKFEEIFPDALEFVSRSMRAGHAFSVSLEMIHREFPEPVAGEFRRTFEEHNFGLPMDLALQKLAGRVPSLDVHFFVSAVLLQKRTGGNLAEILDKLAYVIRERFKLRGRIRAVSAHGKMTATALSCIPIAVAILMFYTNPDYVKFFFSDDIGNLMLGGAVLLQLIGYGIMQKIVNIEV